MFFIFVAVEVHSSPKFRWFSLEQIVEGSHSSRKKEYQGGNMLHYLQAHLLGNQEKQAQ